MKKEERNTRSYQSTNGRNLIVFSNFINLYIQGVSFKTEHLNVWFDSNKARDVSNIVWKVLKASRYIFMNFFTSPVFFARQHILFSLHRIVRVKTHRDVPVVRHRDDSEHEKDNKVLRRCWHSSELFRAMSISGDALFKARNYGLRCAFYLV